MSSISRRVCGDQVQVADRAAAGRRAASRRSRSSASRRVELGRLELRGARGSSSCLERLRAPRWRALPTGPALLGRQLADRAQHAGQLGLAAEVADAQLLELGRPSPRRRSRASASCAQLVQACGSRQPWARHPIRELVQRHGGGHRHVERVGAVGAQRDLRASARPPRPAPPAGRRARPPGRRTTGALGGVTSASGVPAPRSSAIVMPAQLREARPRGRPGEQRAHAGAHGLRRERVGAAGAER